MPPKKTSNVHYGLFFWCGAYIAIYLWRVFGSKLWGLSCLWFAQYLNLLIFKREIIVPFFFVSMGALARMRRAAFTYAQTLSWKVDVSPIMWLILSLLMIGHPLLCLRGLLPPGICWYLHSLILLVMIFILYHGIKMIWTCYYFLQVVSRSTFVFSNAQRSQSFFTTFVQTIHQIESCVNLLGLWLILGTGAYLLSRNRVQKWFRCIN